MKNLIIVLILAAAVFFGYRQFMKEEKEPVEETPSVSTEKSGFNPKSNIFNRPVTEMGLGISKLGGLTELSPEENYLLFGGFLKEGGETEYSFFVTDLSSNRVWEVRGTPVGDWSNNNILVTSEGDNIIFNYLDTGKAQEFKNSDGVYSGYISPDSKKFIYSSKKGLVLLNLESHSMENVSSAEYDGASAWYKDSKRILGYKENPIDNLYEAGKGRLLAIWNTGTKSADTDLGIDMPSSSLRKIEWIVPEKIARVNAGFDDGSFDYIVNLETKFVSDLGETSGMLMGGVVVDSGLQLVGMVGEEIDGPGEMSPLSVAKIVGNDGKTLERRAFDDNFMRQYVQVVNNHTVMYLRKSSSGTHHSDVIYLDFRDGSEKVIYSEDEWLNNLLVTKDKKHWIIGGTDKIIMKEI